MGLFGRKRQQGFEIKIDIDLDIDDGEDEDIRDEDFDYVRGYNGGWIRSGIHDDAPEYKTAPWEKMDMAAGFKLNYDGRWLPPDTVYKEKPHSRYCHAQWHCRGKQIAEKPIPVKGLDLPDSAECPYCDWETHYRNIRKHRDEMKSWTKY
jgi:hypothetical protein